MDTLNGEVTTRVPGLQQVVRGQSIAKTKSWDANDRARLGAMWKLGFISVEPTTRIAALVFGASETSIKKAIAELQSDSARFAQARFWVMRQFEMGQ
jgi:hypothetical protein